MGTRVLAIDDEEDYRLIISDVLKQAGYEVDCCADGAEGLARLEQAGADIVLVDWMMPQMDGETFCRKARAQAKFASLPILMLTVKQTADEELEALHFGVDDFIVKPFAAQELLARVRAALRRSPRSASGS